MLFTSDSELILRRAESRGPVADRVCGSALALLASEGAAPHRDPPRADLTRRRPRGWWMHLYIARRRATGLRVPHRGVPAGPRPRLSRPRHLPPAHASGAFLAQRFTGAHCSAWPGSRLVLTRPLVSFRWPLLHQRVLLRLPPPAGNGLPSLLHASSGSAQGALRPVRARSCAHTTSLPPRVCSRSRGVRSLGGGGQDPQGGRPTHRGTGRRLGAGHSRAAGAGRGAGASPLASLVQRSTGRPRGHAHRARCEHRPLPRPPSCKPPLDACVQCPAAPSPSPTFCAATMCCPASR